MIVPAQRSAEDWESFAECQDDPEAMFVLGKEQNKATRKCRPCLGRVACMAEALDNRIEFGVWGGLTERDRRKLLRQKPTLNWHRALRTELEDEEDRRRAFVEAAGQRDMVTEARALATPAAQVLVEQV